MIREIEEKDYKDCLDIYNYYIKNTTITFELSPLSLDTFKERIKNIKKDYPFLVYEENSKVLGFAYLDHFNFRKAYDRTADLTIYVAKDSKDLEIGTKLLNSIIFEASNKGIKEIISLVTSTNDISIKFHLKNKFKKVGYLENVGLKFEKLLSVYYFQLSI